MLASKHFQLVCVTPGNIIHYFQHKLFQYRLEDQPGDVSSKLRACLLICNQKEARTCARTETRSIYIIIEEENYKLKERLSPRGSEWSPGKSTMKLWDIKRGLSLLAILSLSLTIFVIVRSSGAGHFLFPTTSILSTAPRGWKESRRSSMVRQSNLDWNLSLESSTGSGYILVNQYADQMTGASFSILSLQCWAGAVGKGIKVVEPFVFTGSGFGYTFNTLQKGPKWKKQLVQDENQVRLGDIFDLDKWQKQLDANGYTNAPMEDWKVFLSSAPRDLIIVGKDCSEAESNSCNRKFLKATTLFATKHSFRIVRSVHLQRKIYSLNEFTKVLYGSQDPRRTVVFFQFWGGIVLKLYDDHRYAVTGISRCTRKLYHNFLFENSMSIRKDSKKYAARYIPDQGKRYISIMLRTERFGLHHFRQTTTFTGKMSLFTKCLRAIESEVHNMLSLHNTSGLFLAVDSRKHGSRGLRDNAAPSFMNSTLLNTMTNMLFDRLKPYGSKLTMEEWDASFDVVSSFQAPGYVAQLQKNLAASGRCLVTAGGGSFQQSARLLYRTIHGHDGTCVVDLKDCS